MPNIHEIRFSNTKIGDSTLSLIQSHFKGTPLTKIDISNNLITYIGAIKLLEALSQYKDQIQIDLSENYLTTESIEFLKTKIKEKNLGITLNTNNQKVHHGNQNNYLMNTENFYNDFEYIQQRVKQFWVAYSSPLQASKLKLNQNSNLFSFYQEIVNMRAPYEFSIMNSQLGHSEVEFTLNCI